MALAWTICSCKDTTAESFVSSPPDGVRGCFLVEHDSDIFHYITAVYVLHQSFAEMYQLLVTCYYFSCISSSISMPYQDVQRESSFLGGVGGSKTYRQLS